MLDGAPSVARVVLEGRGPLAARLARLIRDVSETAPSSHDGLRLVHADVVPHSLGERLRGVASATFALVDPGLDRCVGTLLEERPPSDAMPSGTSRPTSASRAFVETHLAPGLLLLPTNDAPRATSEGPLAYVALARADGRGTHRLLLALDAMRSPAPPRSAVGDATLTLGVRAGRLLLRADELTQLGIGDVVLADSGDERALVAEIPGSESEVHLERREGAWCFVAFRPRTRLCESAMNEPNDPLSPPTDARIEVALELGRVVTTYAELVALAPGAILASGVPHDATITLRVGGVAIGRGRLVECEGELAVRITEVASANVVPERPSP